MEHSVLWAVAEELWGEGGGLIWKKQVAVGVEMRTRQRLAQVIFEETEEAGEAEAVLSKGAGYEAAGGRLGDGVWDGGTAGAYSYGDVAEDREDSGEGVCGSGRGVGQGFWGVSEADRHGAAGWEYVFRFQEFEAVSGTGGGGGERLSALSGIQRVSGERGDEAVYVVASLLEVCVRAEGGEYGVARERLEEVSGMAGVFEAVGGLRVVWRVLGVLLDVVEGRGGEAGVRDLHRMLDGLAEDGGWEEVMEVPVGREGGLRLGVQWFSREQLFVYGHLLAGVCYLPDQSSLRAGVFLGEGLEMLGSMVASGALQGESMRTARNGGWARVAWEVCLIYYCFALVLRSDFDKAEGVGGVLVVGEADWSAYPGSGQTVVVFWQQHEGIVCAFEGGVRTVYWPAGGSIEGVRFDTHEYRGDHRLHDERRAHEILDDIGPLCRSSSFAQLRFAWDLVSGSVRRDVHSKNSLLSVISAFDKHANNQLRAIASIVLCSYFTIHSESEQAEKMLISAYLLSRNGGNDLWAFMSGRLLEELMRKKNRKIRAEKQSELNLKHKERILDLFKHASVVSTD
ncbi:hypothetical protein PMAC_001317 [Pneumocystis sp. 'macacae']|nr:hypothetical protein PMAC_001317 [Pneumocystis sp. 'macacae']